MLSRSLLRDLLHRMRLRDKLDGIAGKPNQQEHKQANVRALITKDGWIATTVCFASGMGIPGKGSRLCGCEKGEGGGSPCEEVVLRDRSVAVYVHRRHRLLHEALYQVLAAHSPWRLFAPADQVLAHEPVGTRRRCSGERGARAS